MDAISSGTDLNQIRNCGKTSVREIMEHLFLYQYNSLPAEKQDAYLVEVVEMNRKQEAVLMSPAMRPFFFSAVVSSVNRGSGTQSRKDRTFTA